MANQKQPSHGVTWAAPVNANVGQTYTVSSTNYPVSIGTILTSTGSSFGGFGTSYTTSPPAPMEASDIVITKHGLMVECQWGKILIPHRLLGDIVTMANMGLLDKLAPEGDKDTE